MPSYRYYTSNSERGYLPLSLFDILEFGRLGIKILSYHKRNLEGDRMVELTEIKSRKVTYLFKSVYKGVSMYEELS